MRDDVRIKAEKIRDFLNDHKANDTVIIDVSDKCTWTDCFIISTVTSMGHLKGLAHQLWSELLELGLTVNNRHKSPSSDSWELIDCSDLVIHLMSKEARDFYDLQKLWEVYTSN